MSNFRRNSCATTSRRRLRLYNPPAATVNSWRILYSLEGEPIGRGYAGKVYKIRPASVGGYREPDDNDRNALNKIKVQDNIYYACKVIRRLRFGKDTIDKIRAEIMAMHYLQNNKESGSYLPISLSHLNCDSSFPNPPLSAAPRLIAVYEDQLEVAVVMEYAEGGSLYDLCLAVYNSHDALIPLLSPKNLQPTCRRLSLDMTQICYPCGDLDTSSCRNNNHNGKLESLLDCPDQFLLPEPYIVQLISKVVEALLYMNRYYHMVHLDVKADNILLRKPYPSNDIFLTDFGLATVIEEGQQYRELAGTPDYVAPEILNYDPISYETDMWSVGVLTYFLLTGVSPFLGKDKAETMEKITLGLVDYPPHLFGNRSSQAVEFIKCLLQRNPKRRLSAENALKHCWLNFTVDVPNGKITPNESILPKAHLAPLPLVEYVEPWPTDSLMLFSEPTTSSLSCLFHVAALCTVSRVEIHVQAPKSLPLRFAHNRCDHKLVQRLHGYSNRISTPISGTFNNLDLRNLRLINHRLRERLLRTISNPSNLTVIFHLNNPSANIHCISPPPSTSIKAVEYHGNDRVSHISDNPSSVASSRPKKRPICFQEPVPKSSKLSHLCIDILPSKCTSNTPVLMCSTSATIQPLHSLVYQPNLDTCADTTLRVSSEDIPWFACLPPLALRCMSISWFQSFDYHQFYRIRFDSSISSKRYRSVYHNHRYYHFGIPLLYSYSKLGSNYVKFEDLKLIERQQQQQQRKKNLGSSCTSYSFKNILSNTLDIASSILHISRPTKLQGPHL